MSINTRMHKHIMVLFYNGYYSAIKKNELLFITMSMNLSNKILSKISQTKIKCTIQFHLWKVQNQEKKINLLCQKPGEWLHSGRRERIVIERDKRGLRAIFNLSLCANSCDDSFLQKIFELFHVSMFDLLKIVF